MEWGSIADWVSGLGSFCAVAVALYLSRDSQRIKLSGYCGIRLIIGGGAPQQEFIMLSATNIGHRKAVVCNIGMKVGLFRKRHAIITPMKDAYSDGIPFSIDDGEVAKWAIPLNDDKKWIKDLIGDFVKTTMDAKTLRFLIMTTHGTTKSIKPDANLVEEIINALKDQT